MAIITLEAEKSHSVSRGGYGWESSPAYWLITASAQPGPGETGSSNQHQHIAHSIVRDIDVRARRKSTLAQVKEEMLALADYALVKPTITQVDIRVDGKLWKRVFAHTHSEKLYRAWESSQRRGRPMFGPGARLDGLRGSSEGEKTAIELVKGRGWVSAYATGQHANDGAWLYESYDHVRPSSSKYTIGTVAHLCQFGDAYGLRVYATAAEALAANPYPHR